MHILPKQTTEANLCLSERPEHAACGVQGRLAVLEIEGLEKLLTKPYWSSDAGRLELVRFSLARCYLPAHSARSAMSVDVQMMPSPAMNGHMMNGHANGLSKEPKFASGLILPPPEIKCKSQASRVSGACADSRH